MARSREPVERRSLPAVPSDADEETVRAIHGRIAQRLSLHRQDASAFLARALGDELLDPHAEPADRRAHGERHLVAALERQGSEGGPEREAGVLGPLGPATLCHRAPAREELSDVHPREGRRNDPEI